MRTKAILALCQAILCLTLAPASFAGAASTTTVGAALRGARSSLELVDGQLYGDGAALIAQAVSGARYVAVGEDHLTEQVPAFVAALCDMMAPQGLSALALEIGPVAAFGLGPILKSPNRLQRMAALNRDYPNAIAFLDSRADNDAAAHCLTRSSARPIRLLGLDQEFMGATRLVLDRILATKLTQPAREQLWALRTEDRSRAAEAKESGDASKLLLLSVDPKRLDAVAAALAKGGTPKAQGMFDELVESAAIYALNASGSPVANTERATLLKHHLQAMEVAGDKVLLKFGDWHLYKGFNPLGNRDLGNFIAERADGNNGRSLHILMLAVKGVRAGFAGYDRPPTNTRFVMTQDRDYRWLQTAIDQKLSSGWTLFDLRRLRYRRLAGLDADWSRVVLGYDFLLLVPEFTPSHVIGQPAE